MTVQLTPVERKKLLVAVQMYREALIQASKSFGLVARIASIVDFDFAVETALKAVVGSLDAKRQPTESFDGLLQQVEALLATHDLSAIQNSSQIRHVHSVRNDAQHKARYPLESDVSDARAYVRDFLSTLFSGVWDADFEKFSLVELINDQEVADILNDAETAFASARYQDAAQTAHCALEMALGKVSNSVVGRTPLVNAIMVRDASGTAEPSRELFDAFKRTQQTLLFVALGIPYVDYVRFKEIAGDAYRDPNRKWHHVGTKENMKPDEAEFCVSYAVDAVIRIEAVVGNLDQPFGAHYH